MFEPLQFTIKLQNYELIIIYASIAMCHYCLSRSLVSLDNLTTKFDILLTSLLTFIVSESYK